MKGTLKFCLFTSLLAWANSNSFAMVIQRFFGNYYTNPADFSRTNDFQFTTGVLGMNAHIWYKGQVFGQFGRASSSQNLFPPYFSLAKRLSPKWTVALNVSQPILAVIYFPPKSVVAPLSVVSDYRAAEINPTLVYQVTDRFSIGAGPTIQDYYRADISFIDPVVGYVYDKTNAWVGGWDAGFNWTLNQSTFLGLAYFSKMNVKYHGHSVGGFQAINNLQVKGFPTPGTARLNLAHYFTQKLMGAATLFYTNWSDVQLIKAVNAVPADMNFPVHYKDQIGLAAVTHYDWREKWSFFGMLAYEQTVNRGQGILINFPATSIYGYSLGFDYKINKDITLKTKYGFFWGNAHINHPVGLNATGREPIRVNSVDLSLTYSI